MRKRSKIKLAIWKTLFSDRGDNFDDSEVAYLKKLSEIAV